MNRLIGRRLPIVAFVCLVASVSIVGMSITVRADTETATIQPMSYYALFFQMDEGVGLKFTVTSTVPIYVAVLDTTNYNSYSSTGTITTSLFLTSTAVTSAASTVAAPTTGRYYLVMENSASAQAASVTVDYSFEGTGVSLSGLAIVGVIGAVAAVVVVIVVLMLKKKRGAGPLAQQPVQPMDTTQWQPPTPPPPTPP